MLGGRERRLLFSLCRGNTIRWQFGRFETVFQWFLVDDCVAFCWRVSDFNVCILEVFFRCLKAFTWCLGSFHPVLRLREILRCIIQIRRLNDLLVGVWGFSIHVWMIFSQTPTSIRRLNSFQSFEFLQTLVIVSGLS